MFVLDDIFSSSFEALTLTTNVYIVTGNVTDQQVLEKDYKRKASYAMRTSPTSFATIKEYWRNNGCFVPFRESAAWFLSANIVGLNVQISARWMYANDPIPTPSALVDTCTLADCRIGVTELTTNDGSPGVYFFGPNYQIVTSDLGVIGAGASTKVLANNPRRVAFVMRIIGGSQSYMSYAADAVTAFDLINVGNIATYLVRDFGPLVKGEVWLTPTAAGPQVIVTEVYRVR